MYVDVPTNVSAIELISSPDTPKSQILICPLDMSSTFDGFTSVHEKEVSPRLKVNIQRTSVNNTMHVVEVGQTRHYSEGDLAKDIFGNWANCLVDVVERAEIEYLAFQTSPTPVAAYPLSANSMHMQMWGSCR